MDQSQVLELKQCRQHLLCDWTDVLEGQRLEFALFQEIIKVLLQHFKDQAGVVLVLEALECPHEVEVIGILLAEA